MKRIFGILFLLFFWNIPVHAAYWYVDNQSIGANNGTSWANAWQSFANITWTSVNPGDTIYISGGASSNTYNETLTISKSGTAGNFITIDVGANSPSPSGHSGTVIIDGQDTRTKGIVLNSADYIHINGYDSSNAYKLQIQNTIMSDASGTAIYVYNSNYAYIDYVRIINAKSRGVYFLGSSNGRVRGCDIQSGSVNNAYQTDGIYLGTGSTDDIVENNIVIAGNIDATNHIDPLQTYEVTRITIRNNMFKWLTGSLNPNESAVDMEGTHEWAKIYNNIFVGSDSNTEKMAIFEYPYAGSEYYIWNNTFIATNATGGALEFYAWTTDAVADFKNNIVYTPNGYLYLVTDITSMNPASKFDYNCVYRAAGDKITAWYGNSTDKTWAQWQADGYDVHSVFADPGVNAGNNYRINRTSACINAGADLSAYFTTDYSGASRPIGTTWDMGAYEYNPLTVTINQAGGQADPATTSPVNFTVVFSEAVSDFISGDVTLSGTAGATTAAVTGSGTTYNVAVSGMTSAGTVIASIAVDKATGATGNTNAASSSTDNSVLYNPPGQSIYYVATTGNNSWDGAYPDHSGGGSHGPYQTIQKAISMVGPGDTVYVRGGTYPTFTIDGISGTAGNLITFAGYNNERPLINGGTNPIGIRLTNLSYIDINGFEVTGATGNYTGGITLDNCDNTTIENNLVHDNTAANIAGIKIFGSNNHILNNTVYNNGFSGIHIHDSSSTNNEIGYNTSYNNTLAAGNSDGIGCTDGGSGNNIHHNTVYGNSDDGIDMWICHDNTIANNVAYNNGGTGDGNGIKLGGFNVTAGGKNTVVQNVSYNNLAHGFTTNSSGGNLFYNNTAYGNGSDGFYDGARTSSPELSVFINNIGYNNTRAAVSMATGFTSASHNNMWDNMRWNGTIYATPAAFYAVSGFDNPSAGSASSYDVDPLFVNAGSANFHLQRTSTLINVGDASNPGSIAAIGTPDIGAYEYTPLTVTINQAGGQTDPATTSPVNFTVVFSESVSDFTTGDVTLSGTAGATTATVTGSGTTYNVAVSGMTGSGTVIATIAADKATGATGNTNTTSTSSDNTITFNVAATPPVLTSITISDSAGFTNSTSPSITIVASSAPSNIAFSCNGGTNWSNWFTYSSTITTFSITNGATGCNSTNGTKTITAKLKNVSNEESGTASDTTYYDTTAPTSGSISYTDGYYATASVALTAADGSDGSGSGINTSSRIVQRQSATLSGASCGSYNSFSTITPSGSYPNFTDTTVTTGNCYKYRYLVSDNLGAQATYTSSNTAKIYTTSPTVTINQKSDQTDPTSNTPINFTVVFSETVLDFATGDVTLAGTAGATTATVTGSGTTYNVAVSGMTGSGTVIASINAGRATGYTGNASLASTSTDNTVTYVYSSTPSLTLSSVAPDPTTNTAPAIIGTATDTNGTIGGVYYQIDSTSGSWSNCVANDGAFDEATETFTCTTTALTDGNHTYYVRAQDNDLEYSVNSSDNFLIDSTPPSIPSSVAFTTASSDNTPSITWGSATDAGVGLANPAYSIAWSKDSNFLSGVYTATTNSNTYTVTNSLDNAAWYFKVRAQDTLGNYSNYSQSINISINAKSESKKHSSHSKHSSNKSSGPSGLITVTKIDNIGVYPQISAVSKAWNTYYSRSQKPFFYGNGATNGTKVTVYTWPGIKVCTTVVSGGLWGCAPTTNMTIKTHRIDIMYGSKLLPPFNLRIGGGYLPTTTYSNTLPSKPTTTSVTTPSMPVSTPTTSANDGSVFGNIMNNIKGNVKGDSDYRPEANNGTKTNRRNLIVFMAGGTGLVLLLIWSYLQFFKSLK